MFFLQESAAVIVALFELNTPEFSMMLTVLPKSFQVMGKISLSVALFFLSFFIRRSIVLSNILQISLL